MKKTLHGILKLPEFYSANRLPTRGFLIRTQWNRPIKVGPPYSLYNTFEVSPTLKLQISNGVGYVLIELEYARDEGVYGANRYLIRRWYSEALRFKFSADALMHAMFEPVEFLDGTVGCFNST